MLTEKECSRIFSGLPYRDGWRPNDLMFELNMLEHFYFYQSQNAGYSNYFEYIGYPAGVTKGNAIIICVSACASIAAYGQITFSMGANVFGHNFLEIEALNLVTADELKPLEQEVIKLLWHNGIEIIDKAFASRKLPFEVAAHEDVEGDLYFHGLFQRGS